jgi:hypothetical protein
MASLGNTALETLSVKKGASTATLSFYRNGDGSMEFVDVNSNNVRVDGSNVDMRKLFDAISALV